MFTEVLNSDLPPFPPFNDNWEAPVQSEWLATYLELAKFETEVALGNYVIVKGGEVMGNPEEPQYQIFDYVCEKCGAEFQQASSVRLHPDHQDCPYCAYIVETLTGLETMNIAVKGWG